MAEHKDTKRSGTGGEGRKVVDAINTDTKNKSSNPRGSFTDNSMMSLMMDINEINDRRDAIISASEKVTTAQIKNTKKFYTEEAKTFDQYIKSVKKSSDSTYSSFKDGSGGGSAKTGTSPKQVTNSSFESMRSGMSDNVKDFTKASEVLSKSVSAAASLMTKVLADSANIVRDRYNTIELEVGNRKKADEIYDKLASSNKSLANELHASLSNTISPEEFTKMQSEVIKYYKKDANAISKMSTSLVQYAEVGMTINGEFLRTSNYIYKQSGKNERSLMTTLDSIYSLATKSDNLTKEEISELAADAMKTGQLVAGKASKNGIAFNEDTYMKSNLSAKTTLADVGGQWGPELQQTFDNLSDYIVNITAQDMSSDTATSLANMMGTNLLDVQRLQQTDPEKFAKLLMTSMKDFNRYDATAMTAIGLDQSSISAIEAGFKDSSTNDLLAGFDKSMSAVEGDSLDSIRKSIEDQRGTVGESISNTLKETSVDSIPPNIAELVTLVSGISSMMLASQIFSNTKIGSKVLEGGKNLASKGLQKLGFGTKAAQATASSTEIATSAANGGGALSKVSSFLSSPGARIGGGAIGGLLIAGDGVKGFESADRRFGKDGKVTTGETTSSVIGSALGGDGAGGLQSAFAGAGKGAALGTSIAGPIGTAVGGAIGAVLGAVGGDKLSASLEDNIMKPIGAIGDSLGNGGEDLISNIFSVGEGLGDTLKDISTGLGDTLGEIPLIGGILETGADILGSVFGGLGDIVGTLGDGIQGAVDWVVDGAGDAWDGITDFFGFGGPDDGMNSIINGYSGAHNGVDIGMPRGTPVVSPISGTVIDSATSTDGSWKKYGSDGPLKYMSVQDDNGLVHRFLHLSNNGMVSKGSRVSKGKVLGLSGNTGRSTGPHLHYDVSSGGRFINPLSYQSYGTGGDDLLGSSMTQSSGSVVTSQYQEIVVTPNNSDVVAELRYMVSALSSKLDNVTRAIISTSSKPLSAGEYEY